VSFFSHRETRTASDVTLAMYFVFFWSSSDPPEPDPSGLVIAATTAEAEFEFDCDGADVSLLLVCRLDLLIVTVVQSWQSGASRSGVLYLFFVDIDINYLFNNININKKCLYSLFIFISNKLLE
jgi:hypothetical protein